MKSNKSEQQSWVASVFILAAGLCRKLPAFRGRNRLFLMLYKILGLKNKHIHVNAQLESPVSFRANLDLHSWLQRLAFLTGSYESDAVTFLHRLHSSQDSRGCMLDIGANIGLISIPFALMSQSQMQNKIKVISVEAVPDNLKALTENITLNSLQSSIKVIGTALGDTSKTIEIQVEGDLASGEGTGTANILPDGSDFRCVRQKLELKTMDSLLDIGELPEDCSVVKIDTDGYDLKIFQGGVRFLHQNRPVIFGEFATHCMSWHKQSIRDVVDFASQNNYLVYQRVSGSWKFSTLIKPDIFQQDLLLVPIENKEKFNWCLIAE